MYLKKESSSPLTFQQLRTNIHKLQFLPQVALVEFPDAGDEGILFCSAAGNPAVHLLKVKVKFRVFLTNRGRKTSAWT